MCGEGQVQAEGTVSSKARRAWQAGAPGWLTEFLGPQKGEEIEATPERPGAKSHKRQAPF